PPIPGRRKYPDKPTSPTLPTHVVACRGTRATVDGACNPRVGGPAGPVPACAIPCCQGPSGVLSLGRPSDKDTSGERWTVREEAPHGQRDLGTGRAVEHANVRAAPRPGAGDDVGLPVAGQVRPCHEDAAREAGRIGEEAVQRNDLTHEE